MLILQNYKSYSIDLLKNDTVEVIKYKNQYGIFLDSSAAVTLTKKTMLFDSLARIIIINESIIKRQELQISNGKLLETEFNSYVISADKEKVALNKKFKLKLLGKNIIIGLQTTALLVVGTLYLLK